MYTSERDKSAICFLCGDNSDMIFNCDSHAIIKGSMALALCFDCTNAIKDGAEEVFDNWGYVKKSN